jgi:hypothetical protein
MSEGFRPSIDPDELEAPADATSLSRTVARPPQRWHRWLTVPSGWTLFVCLFLPSIKLCDTAAPIPMAAVPFLWPAYVVGVLIALAATCAPAAIRGNGLALFILIRTSAAGVGAAAILEIIETGAPGEAVIALVISCIVFATTWRDATERAVAAVSLLAAVATFALTLAIALQRLAVWGATIGAIAAGILVLGTLCWSIEAHMRSS